jgi:hypothetical protein
MSTLFRLLPLTGVLLIACWVGLRVRGDRLTALRELPSARLAPVAVALVTMGVIWYLWGSLRQGAVFHDEASYLLQAETFAHWRWAMASPPLPSFFEQFHVFVTPTFASKYPPGHGILLVPGIWLGLPGLVPLLLSGLAAAILFVLVRRVTNGWVALITFALWLPMQENLWFRASYFSENTTSVLWLLGWFALLKWRETAQQRWLSTVAACTAWMAITRPLTALAFALPVGAVVLWDIARQRKWRSLMHPAVLGLAILSLLPVWNAKTTGNWRETPYGLYSKIYFPFDVMGFGRDTTPAARPLPTDMQHFTQAFGPVHATHTVDRLPRIFYERWSVLFDEAFSGLRVALVLFALVALTTMSAAGWFAAIGAVVLTVCYLLFAHPASWDLYYLEIAPLFPFFAACGIWTTWLALGKHDGATRRTLLRTTTPQAALAGTIILVLLLVPARTEIVRAQRGQAVRRTYQAKFTSAVARLPEERTIVFIRYAAAHDIHKSLIANHANLADARAWLVYDRGSENAALTALAPGRTPYLYDDATSTFERLDRGADSAAPPAVIR